MQTPRRSIGLLALALTCASSVSADVGGSPPPSSADTRVRALAGYDALLQAAVKGRMVDYAVVEREAPALRAFIESVRSTPIEGKDGLASVTKEQRLAFYTNAYNATVLALVLEHKRPKSVLSVDGFFDKKKHTIAGESLTLNELEEKKIRASGDPRVHFVVNCASDDCPPLAPFAYRGESWERDLENQTRAYLARPGEVAIDDAKKTITVVQLFEWYRGDFGGDDGVRKFLARYDAARAKTLMEKSYTLAYRPYDWDLNTVR